MLVLPRDEKFSGSKVKKLLGVRKLRFATPIEISELTGEFKSAEFPRLGTYLELKFLPKPRF